VYFLIAQEDIAEDWLAQNDPLYGKKQSIYLTANRINKIYRKEKPTRITGNLLFYRKQVT
jgi:hypothetical protein